MNKFLPGLWLFLAWALLTCVVSIAAQDDNLPAIPHLTPRPTTVKPTSTPIPTSVAPHPSPQGGFIKLSVVQSTYQAHLWTIVQWQDGLGNWHDVEGWRGAPNENSQVIWWVADRDTNKGPFRWVIYQVPGGKQLAQSESFYLPRRGQIVRISISTP